jgi:hypothetical protein
MASLTISRALFQDLKSNVLRLFFLFWWLLER